MSAELLGIILSGLPILSPMVVVCFLVCRYVLRPMPEPKPVVVERELPLKPVRVEPVDNDDKMRRKSAIGTVNRVRDEYATKLLDIGYVIENHALFDLSHQPTLAFEEQNILMSQWNLNAVALEALERGAARLGSLWLAAVSHAERLGFDALSDPDVGKRAVKTVEIAQRGSTEGERQAARQALDGMLVALRIVVPEQTRKALSGQRLALNRH